MISRRTQTFITRAHTWIYRRSGGRVGSRLGSIPQVLLTTTGRASGLPRTTPLTGIPHGDGVLLVASDGGKPLDPQWYRNLVADGQILMQLGGHQIPMRARTATPAERAELWPRVVEVYGGYATYQGRTERQIPLVICEPILL